MFVGMLLLILALVIFIRDKSMLQKCVQATMERVIRYTFWNNNGVHFPVVEYVVGHVTYTQTLKYRWVIRVSSSFHKMKTEVKNDVYRNNLVIHNNSHFYTNPLEKYFPIGTELKVFYNPDKPKKSYVMRFVKSPSVKNFFFVGFLLLPV